jgi:hypothetical protein
METSSGRRLELVYSITPRSGTAESADFFVKQHARLKERIVSWPEDLSKVVYLLDHKYSQANLFSSNMEAHDRTVIKTLLSACSEAGIYLFLGNVTKKEFEQDYITSYDCDDGGEAGVYMDYLCTAEGKRIASCVSLSEQHLIPADPYSNRSADEVEEDDVDFGMVDDEERMPDKLVYHDSVSSSQLCREALCSVNRV